MPPRNLLASDLITTAFRLTPPQKTALAKLRLSTLRDLLYYFPTRHNDAGKIGTIAETQTNEHVTVYGQVVEVKTGKTYTSKMPVGEALIEDASGRLKAMWFHQPYVAKMLQAGDFVKLDGKLNRGKGLPSMINPEFEKVQAIPSDIAGSLFARTDTDDVAIVSSQSTLYPVYPESRGITSRWIYHAIERVLASGVAQQIPDPIPEDILRKYSLPSLHSAFIYIHAPREEAHAQSARKRFAFEEIFLIQLKRQAARKAYAMNPSFRVEPPKADLHDFVSRFPFPMTGAQSRAIDAILDDFTKGRPMLRLLEGDVGSGKTAVAAVTAFSVVTTAPPERTHGNLQVAYMCPTEILAGQLFASLAEYFKHLNIPVGLLTGSGCKKFPSKLDPSGATSISRAQLLKWVASGEIPILVGTHALIQKAVKFANLAYVIIDEQHRFGTDQRAKLVRKDKYAPHFLSMTATPIPRTLALTIYGDLDITLLDELPAGRKPVTTEIVLPGKREDVYALLRKELDAGRQAYVICPRIDEPDPDKEMALTAKSVTEEASRLKKSVFPDRNIAIMHGKMKPEEKDRVMLDFAEHKTDILVATSVVEVGVNVPNATVIVIEGADRFGLSQLHQLRGRVLRSSHQPYCFLFADAKSKKTIDRLKALVTAKNGFALSELDLTLRGAGELSGKKQWGISDIGMEAIRNIKMVEAARTEAVRLLDEDTTLRKYPDLVATLATRSVADHWE